MGAWQEGIVDGSSSSGVSVKHLFHLRSESDLTKLKQSADTKQKSYRSVAMLMLS